MISATNNLPRPAHKRVEVNGFALISSIIVMALLLLIAVASMSLSSVSTSTSSFSRHQANAKANARMALCIAIAELQKHTGHDQVITTRADLLDQEVETDATKKVLHGQYTLAFKTQPIGGDYRQDEFGNGIFLREAAGLPAVLVSGNEGYNLSDTAVSIYPEGYTNQDTVVDDTFVTLFRNSSDITTSVRVPRVKVQLKENQGSYAYWVTGENTKARINLNDPFLSRNDALKRDSSTSSGRFYSIESPVSPNLRWAGTNRSGSAGFLNDLAIKPSLSSQIYSLNSLALTSDQDIKKAVKQHFHDFSADSYSLLTNAKHGGLKKNLTAAVNTSDNDFKDLIKHSGTEADHKDPILLYKNHSFPNRKDNIDYLNYPGSVWEHFRSYVRRPEYEPELTGVNPQLLAHLGGKAHHISHYWEEDKQSNSELRSRLVRRTPVLQRFQISIDYSLGYEGVVEDSGAKWHEFSMRQHFIPMVSYWNPYNVTLTTADNHKYSIYNNLDYGTHQHHSIFNAHFVGQPEWKVFAMEKDNSPVAWSGVKSSSARFSFPFHPTGGVKGSRYSKTNYGVQIRPFTIAPGETATFALIGKNQPLDYSRKNYLEKVSDISDVVGYSFYVKTAKFRVKVVDGLTMEEATPELELLRYPSSGGDSLTRLSVTNSTSFQQTNLNFGSVTSRAKLTFTPTIIKDDERLPSSDENGTESPKFAGVVLRKQVDFSQYYPNGSSWEKRTTGFDTNPYNAPFNALYNPLAARQSAYGRTIGSRSFTFTAPFMYLSGVIVSQSDYNLVSPQMTADGKTYVGYSDTISGGSEKSIQYSLPRQETRFTNIAQLNQMNLSKWLSGYNANQDFASVTDSLMQNNSIGNSFASPHIAPNRTSVEAYDNTSYGGQRNRDYSATQYDTSFHYNEALWDRYFMTGEREGEITSIEGLTNKLPNQNLVPITGATLKKHKDPHSSASQLILKGGFNVNSTSVEAWKAMLSATIGMRTSANDSQNISLAPFPRTSYSGATPLTSPPTDVTEKTLYDGSTYRALTEDEVTALAENIVSENKLRGPYYSLSQFVNRSLSPSLHYRQTKLGQILTSDQVCYEGALQSAINRTGINGVLNQAQPNYPAEVTVNQELSTKTDGTDQYSDYEKGKINPKALKYHPGFGYSSTLTQADMLSRIGHMLTVRSDTFKIRTYGESNDTNGNVIATAYCEAVVQRTAQWFNPADSSSTSPNQWQLTKDNHGEWTPNPELSDVSHRFGRRYSIKSFRWLPKEEV